MLMNACKCKEFWSIYYTLRAYLRYNAAGKWHWTETDTATAVTFQHYDNLEHLFPCIASTTLHCSGCAGKHVCRHARKIVSSLKMSRSFWNDRLILETLWEKNLFLCANGIKKPSKTTFPSTFDALNMQILQQEEDYFLQKRVSSLGANE